MSNFGIVCEFNPFHNGHKYLFDEARRLGAERIVCIMSGNAVQRGGMAIADKYERAEVALRCGADLVIELPFPWSAASAEHFGRAAISGLSGLCQKLIFGSESGDTERLMKIAELCESDDFKAEYSRRLESGEGAATAYTELIKTQGFGEIASNDLLGISYLRACIAGDHSLKCHAVKRVGATINEKELVRGSLQSATAIRERLRECDIVELEAFMPKASADKMAELREDGELTDISYIERGMIAYLRRCDSEALDGIAECGGGVGNRICAAAAEAVSYEELCCRLRTKRYTDAKQRRAVLYALCGVTEGDVKAMPEYFLLLAANGRGRELLASVRRAEGVRIITKPADTPLCRQRELDTSLEAWFTLASKKPRGVNSRLLRGAYIEK